MYSCYLLYGTWYLGYLVDFNSLEGVWWGRLRRCVVRSSGLGWRFYMRCSGGMWFLLCRRDKPAYTIIVPLQQ